MSIIVKGYTAESFAQELETEQRYSSITREEFFNEDEVKVEEDSIDFQAIYNAASDMDIMQKFIDRHNIKSSSGNRKIDYSSELNTLKVMLTCWIKCKDMPSDISMSDDAAYTCKVMYFLFIYNRYISSWNARHRFAAFDKWLKKRSRS
jgi:hypothetical protein